MKRVIQFFLPDMRVVSLREKALSAFLAFIATLLCINVSAFVIDISAEPVYIASLGAAAVLLFAAPNSSFAQPWPFIGSHIVCALVGVFCFKHVEYFPLAAALAVSVSIFVMYILRCLHPPGGAVALAVVLGGPEIHQLGYSYVLSPVLINVLILFLLAFLFNNLAPGRSYPVNALEAPVSGDTGPGLQSSLYNHADLEAALGEMDSYIDISRADLDRIYRLAVSHASQRRVGDVFCRDIMSKNLLSFEYSTELESAWKDLHKAELKAAPVVDSFKRVIGMVTIRDFVRHANVESHPDIFARIGSFLKRTDGQTSEKPEVVGQIMSAPAIIMEEDQHIIQLLDVFAENKIHHMPIVDEKKYLVGMVTRSDVMRALAVLRS